jgi:hypothetical protein
MSRFTDAEYEAAIDDMMAKPGIVSRFITDGESNDNLDRLALLLLSRDLPRMDKSERDDRLRDQYDAVREAMLKDFAGFCHRVRGHHRGSGNYSLVDAYILNAQDEARLDSAA